MSDTFIWRVHATASGGGKFVVSRAQFGDGYSQAVPRGINPHQQEWDVTVSDYTVGIKVVRDFLANHIGESFLWTPPMGTEGYYRCDEGYQPVYQGGGYWTLSMKFTEVFLP